MTVAKKAGSHVSGDEVVRVSGHGHGQQERVERIVRLVYRRQTIQHERALEVVDHSADPVRLGDGLQARIPAGPDQFIELRLRGDQLESGGAPSPVDGVGGTMGGR